jgi:hypothetical protein
MAGFESSRLAAGEQFSRRTFLLANGDGRDRGSCRTLQLQRLQTPSRSETMTVISDRIIVTPAVTMTADLPESNVMAYFEIRDKEIRRD